MEPLQSAIGDLKTLFSTQLAEFQRSLEKAAPTPTISTLAAEFGSFKKFVITALSQLQSQANLLAQECDRIEMSGRRKFLLVHGVVEGQGEETKAALLKLASERLKVTLSSDRISRCHRFGRVAGSKPRPILVKFAQAADRDKLWFAKTALKGSGITISEFLTRTRHEVFMEARKRVGISKCWTKNGVIVATAADGSHHRLTSMCELDKFIPVTATPSVQATITPSGRGNQEAATNRTRRLKR